MNTSEISQLKPLDMVAVRVRIPDFNVKMEPFVTPGLLPYEPAPSTAFNVNEALRWFTFKSAHDTHVIALDPDGVTEYALLNEVIVQVKRL